MMILVFVFAVVADDLIKLKAQKDCLLTLFLGLRVRSVRQAEVEQW